MPSGEAVNRRRRRKADRKNDVWCRDFAFDRTHSGTGAAVGPLFVADRHSRVLQLVGQRIHRTASYLDRRGEARDEFTETPNAARRGGRQNLTFALKTSECTSRSLRMRVPGIWIIDPLIWFSNV